MLAIIGLRDNMIYEERALRRSAHCFGALLWMRVAWLVS